MSSVPGIRRSAVWFPSVHLPIVDTISVVVSCEPVSDRSGDEVDHLVAVREAIRQGITAENC